MSKATWTQEDINKLKKLYEEGASGTKLQEEFPDRTMTSINTKAYKLGFTKLAIKSNNPNFKADYQDYDWCYERYVVKGMTMQEMADEAGCKLRTIQKWCGDIHKLHIQTLKDHLKLNDIQKQIIMFGTLGDGHIDKRPGRPMYIESHAEDQKDYLFWKYEQLKNLCASGPKRREACYKEFNGKEYLCQPQYRIETHYITELTTIRETPRKDIINQLNNLGLSLHLLDDGYRSESAWSICLASFTDEERDLYIEVCRNKFGLNCKKAHDERYVNFTADSSRKIDDIILAILPNDLDIIQNKILGKHRHMAQKHYYINDGDQILQVTQWGRNSGLSSARIQKITDKMKELNVDTITDDDAKKYAGVN